MPTWVYSQDLAPDFIADYGRIEAERLVESNARDEAQRQGVILDDYIRTYRFPMAWVKTKDGRALVDISIAGATEPDVVRLMIHWPYARAADALGT